MNECDGFRSLHEAVMILPVMDQTAVVNSKPAVHTRAFLRSSLRPQPVRWLIALCFSPFKYHRTSKAVLSSSQGSPGPNHGGLSSAT